MGKSVGCAGSAGDWRGLKFSCGGVDSVIRFTGGLIGKPTNRGEKQFGRVFQWFRPRSKIGTVSWVVVRCDLQFTCTAPANDR